MTIDLDLPGRQVGDIVLKWSDNATPLGYYPVPVISLGGGDGPVALVLGGVHGDEFEGPAAIMRLAEALDPDALRGQVILIPALNAPALGASARVSPLDGQNLNRAFPGDPDGGPTAMLAHFVETHLIARADAVIDLHSGGRASVFAPCALFTQTADVALTKANFDLATAFGLPLIWALGHHNDNRSVNAACAQAGVPMIAAELGGGGNVDPAICSQAEDGVRRCLERLGVLQGSPEKPGTGRVVEIAAPGHSLYAPAAGLFDRCCAAGQDVKAGDRAGRLHFPLEPSRPAIDLEFTDDGLVLAHGNRGMVQRGDLLALVARDLDRFA